MPSVLLKGRPTRIYKHPKQIEPLATHWVFFASDRTRRSNLTGHASPRPVALRRPCVPRISTVTARSSNGHCAPTVKHDDRTRRSNDRTHRTHSAAHPRRNDRTRSTQRPDATVPASGRSTVSSLRDRTRPIMCDRTRLIMCDRMRCASAQPFTTHCSSRCLTGRSGPASDRTRRLQTLPRLPDCCAILTGRVRSNRDRVRCSVRSPL
jgi:hypothetical protein